MREGLDYYIGGAFKQHGARRSPEGRLVLCAEFDAVLLYASVDAKLGPGTPRLKGLSIREDPGKHYTSDGTQVADERFADSIAALDEDSVSLGSNISVRRAV